MTGQTLAREGRNCWKRARAERLTFLMESRAYFEQLAATLEVAQRSVLIAGWDVHSRVCLRRDRGEDGELARLLDHVVAKRPELQVHLLVWDCNVFCKIVREKLQTLRLGWQTHPRIHFHLDGKHAVGACHHEKVVVVDDAVAFVGGIDLTARRWDTAKHSPEEPRRVDPAGNPYAPYHDLQVAVSGPAARALGDLMRRRWERAKEERLEPPQIENDPWPAGLEPDLRQVDVGIARTLVGPDDTYSVREIEAMYLDAIDAGRQSIFIENQYLTSDAICGALIEKLRRADGPEVCIIGPLRLAGWLEESVMGPLRAGTLARLHNADHAGRLQVWYPHREGLGDKTITVHSKVMVVDGRFLTLGSANVSNRSMGLDTECNVFLEAGDDPAVGREICAFRNRLIGLHLGQPHSRVASAIERNGTLNGAIEALRGGERTLNRLDPEPPEESEALRLAERLLDPEQPIEWSRLAQTFFGA